MRRALTLIALFLAAACSEQRKEEANVFEVLPNIPFPPAATIIGRESGAEAVKIRFRSTMEPDSVAKYYRGVLGGPPWRLMSDVKTAEGVITLYAEQDGPPLWVTIRRADGGSGSFVDLAGAKHR